MANLRGVVLAWIAVCGCGDHQRSNATATRAASPAVPLTTITPVTAAIALGATPLAVDELGIPRLLRGAGAPAMPAATAAASARLHVERLAPAWGVRAGATPVLEPIADVRLLGATISRLRQVIDGMPVEDGELRVMTRGAGELVAASGILRAADAPRSAPRYAFDDAGAVARAVAATYDKAFPAAALTAIDRTSDGARLLAGHAGALTVSRARARKAWFAASRAPGATLVAAWIVEAYASNGATTDGDAFHVVLSDDGRVLERHSLVADDAFNYRVFAETTGELHPFDGPIVDSSPNATGHPGGTFPPFAPPNLVSVTGLDHPAGQATPDPWLAAGATETSGNNSDAYADFNAPDGLTSGDFRAATTAAGVFDRTYDLSIGPMTSQGQQMAGITSLFYIVNWMHDFWYDGGFTEAAGNAQSANYGRGGQEHDALLTEAQDNALGGSRNNANMSTPADGMPPRIQVFLWTGKDDHVLSISGRTPPTGSAAFGPGNFTITGPVVLADDGTGTVTDACTALSAPQTGNIVVVDRGTCSFKTKALNVQNAGGIGMILVNNSTTATTPPAMGDDATITTPITIASLSVLLAEGTQIKTDIAAGAVTATMTRTLGPDLEGSLDASVVAHEFGHMVHHRLTQCTTAFCNAMSEGWADFSSLLMVSRAGDNFMAAFPLAIYSTLSISPEPTYYGIRRAPYSADHTINDLSFRHMADGEPTPTTQPFLVLGNNAEVHNAGEVWASMLWEGYVALQQAGTSFDAVRLTMRQYEVAGLLMAPPQATPTETREAILTAVHAAAPADYDLLVHAYARRGFGSCAVSAPRDSTSFVGIVESADVKGNAVVGTIDMSSVTSCDADTVLDGGETVHVKVPVANNGDTALSNVAVALSSTTPGITIATPSVTIGSLAPYTTMSATFEVALADTVTTPLAGDFKATVTSTGGCVDTAEMSIAMRLNTDDVPASSATDSFDAGTSIWVPSGTAGQWSHGNVTPLDGAWTGADAATQTDAALVSPPLTADATQPLTITFSHKFSFEFSSNTVFDGGVIEYSDDGGVTWNDLGALAATSPYNATITTTSDNPLAGRAAFGHTNPAYPAADTVTLDLGTQLAGKTFLVRFRIVTDSGTGAPGWRIDNVAFSGIVGTPFPTLVVDAGSCNAGDDAGTTPDGGTNPGNGGGCCQAGGLPAGNGLVAFGVLALLVRRRRRG